MASKSLRGWICYLNSKVQPNLLEVLLDTTTTAPSTAFTLNAIPVYTQGTAVTNTTSAITITGTDYYKISYLANGTTADAGTVVVTPYINGAARAEYAFSSVAAAAGVVSTSGDFIVQGPAKIELYNTGIELSGVSGVITVEKI
ncbi:MAG: hypothetical protein J6D12_08325 [Peptostreptococcaceae bacterium]|nr:hypothetical protein [Peptostreptococcaceae bacterium]